MTLENACPNWEKARSAFWLNATPEQIYDCIDNRGASPRARVGLFRYTILHLVAMLNRNPDVIRALVCKGADVNALSLFAKDTPLHFAAKHNSNPEVVIALLEQENIDATLKNWQGRTSFDILQRNPHLNNTRAYEALGRASRQITDI